ncbi:autotransporter-associated N-terminal domain-containing protein [Fusobacterium canifelinum]|uniref:Autotransporter-associated N-terminal domain-containing protein n=1 Tax=Fusobacterium canifelinum TaxID=285729 RepID=A0A7T4FNZ7_9FUSO|nr:autotransporter-associated N-terminal domain-containing protein [Fusobacterium canifelinum]QQB73986.1 autotransporter-associated N-terminal domain-containing protein [Fusobacterium canifelinum]
MSNNLYKVEKDLRSIAKRYKSIKYSIGLAILFLMLGTGAFSEEVNTAANGVPTREEIATSRENLRNSVGSLQSKIDEARAENSKSLAGLRLELIQLMEQGDQVVKSPWSSWQFGANYMYSKWNGTYKGRGDKAEKYPFEGIFTRSNDPFERYTSPESPNYGVLPVSTDPYSASTNARKGLGSGYGIASTIPKQEPIVSIDVEAGIRPKSVSIEIPDLGIQAPVLAALNVSGEEPKSVTVPTPTAPSITVVKAEPNANPFANFGFTGVGYLVIRNQGTMATTPAVYTGKGEKLWAGVDTNGNPTTGAGGEADSSGNAVTPYASDRPGIVTYLNNSGNQVLPKPESGTLGGFWFENVNLYLKGSNSVADKIIGSTGQKKVAGQVGLHTVANGTIKDVNANLYGQAAFHSIETWHAGHNRYDNVKVNLSGKDNTVFLIYPALYDTLLFHTSKTYNADDKSAISGTYNKRGEFIGTVDVTIPETATRNIIYNILGVQASFDITSNGNYILEGQGNMVYSGYGYSPDYGTLLGQTQSATYNGKTYITKIGKASNRDPQNTAEGMTPSINLSKAVQSYGDDNIILYFANKNKNVADDPYADGNLQDNTATGKYSVQLEKWKESQVGIYQGEIRAKAVIGNQLNIANGTAQTGGNKTGGDSSYVETNVGIFSRSGQRNETNGRRITPTEDLGATAIFDKDPIKALQVNDIDIQFGKYSRSGIMIASEYGTEIDVAMSTNDKRVIDIMSGPIKDYGSEVGVAQGKISADNSKNEAASGTIIAYASGVWDNSKHSMSSATENKLKGSPSTINIGKDVELTGRYLLTSGTIGTSTERGINPIAYLATDGGYIKAGGNTTAKGFYSIIGFADGKNAAYNKKSTIDIGGNITATDEWVSSDAATKPYRYKNIAGLAKDGGTVNINGIIKVAGTAGFADGVGSVVNINKTNNNIQTGTAGALIALNGGEVNFAGGNIYQEDKATTGNIVASGTDTVSHSSSVPFYADNSSSKINFNGVTNIYMSDGILMNGSANDYEGATAVAGSKYHKMQNVTVNLTGDNVVLRTYQGDTTNWTGGAVGINSVKNDMKLAAINANGHGYKIYYIDGVFNLVNNQNLDDTADEFNTKIGLSNEQFNIASGVNVTSATGKGLSMASHENATKNTTTGYTNNGIVNITGGNISSTTALSTSYGYIKNKGTINVDKGIGAYGINGSQLTNDSKINITLNGVGMAAFASSSALKNYGTDAKISAGTLTSSDKVLELINNGTINVAGNGSIGLYAKTNDISNKLTATNGIITNNGKIVLTGDNSVGIVSDSSNNGKGSIINLGGTGSSDIVVGKSGIGVYAGDKSVINFTGNTGVEVKDKGVGIFVDKTTTLNPSGNIFEIKYTGSSSGSGAGIFYNSTKTNTANVNIINNGSAKGVVGLFTNAGTLTNNATITDMSGKAYGIYADGANVVNNGTLTIGDAGKGILSTGGDVTLTSGSTITLGANEAIGVYTKGAGNKVHAQNGANLTIGDGSFGFINEGKGNTIQSDIASQTVGNNTIYAFSRDTTGKIINNTILNSTGSENYGLYGSGIITNNADINYGSGIGNVGIYSTYGGTATNVSGIITVGASDDESITTNRRFAIGMAAGYVGDTSTPAYTGNIINNGTIKVNGEYSIGMYGTGSGTTVTNNKDIELSANNTTGIYLDKGAYGINNGTIKSVGTGLKNVIGVFVRDGSTIENNGTIEIDATNAIGLLSKGNAAGNNVGKIKNYGTLNITGSGAKKSEVPEEGKEIAKSLEGIKINTPAGSSVATITVNGKPVIPKLVTTSAQEYKEMQLSTIGMYIDTSNKRFTNPITGLSALSGLTNADLILGNEAAQNTTSKYIQVAKKILDPYNAMIRKNPQVEKWNIYSGALTWMASVAQNQTDGTIENAYMAKIPYTYWAGKQSTPVDKKDTYNFLDGLEQRYGVEDIGTRENGVFQKLNSIGNNEEILFFQAIDEMMGHQYANTQQRVQATGIILDKEFKYLREEWRTASKDSNKVKVFGTNGEYKTDTAGVIDYKNNAYGVAYVHEDEDIKLGRGTGWYTGIVHNTFKFKDIGRSKEQMLQAKVGLLKSVPFDDNNSLNWTISGDIFVGRNRMHRKFLVVDEIFNAKSRYYTYGIGVRNEIGKEFRLSEGFTLRPYAALKLEYGRLSKIREKSGEIKLEVKQNQYFSVRPEIGAELGFKHYFGMKALKTTLGVAYENELGRVANGKNKARVVDTKADWFNIRGEKEDRKGNVKFDLNVGVDNTRVGVTANVGYDTKGENLRGGLGLRIIF